MANESSAKRVNPITRANYVSVGESTDMDDDKNYDPLMALGKIVGSPVNHDPAITPEAFDNLEFEQDLESELIQGLEEPTSFYDPSGSDAAFEPQAISGVEELEPSYAKPVLQSFADLQSAFEKAPAEDAAPQSEDLAPPSHFSWQENAFSPVDAPDMPAPIEAESFDVQEVEASAHEVVAASTQESALFRLAPVPTEPVSIAEEISTGYDEVTEIIPSISVEEDVAVIVDQSQFETIEGAPAQVFETTDEISTIEVNYSSGFEDEMAAHLELQFENAGSLEADVPHAEPDVSAPLEAANQYGEPADHTLAENSALEPEFDQALDNVLAVEFEAAMAGSHEDLSDASHADGVAMPPVNTPFDRQVDTALDEMQYPEQSDAELGWSGELAGELEQILATSQPADVQVAEIAETASEISTANMDIAPAANGVETSPPIDLSAEMQANVVAFEQELAGDLKSSFEDETDITIPAEPAYVGAQKKKSGGMRMAAVLLGIAAIGGGGAMGYEYFSGNSTVQPAQVILASTADVKVKPKEPGGKKILNQDQLVFQKVNGKPDAKPVQERLTSGTEKPVRVVSTDSVAPVVQPIGSNAAPSRPIKSAARVAPEDTLLRRTENAIITPRKVRTVLIRPDGTIISNAKSAKPKANSNPVSVAKVAPTKVATMKVMPKKIVGSVQPVAPVTKAVTLPLTTVDPKRVAKKATAKPDIKVASLQPLEQGVRSTGRIASPSVNPAPRPVFSPPKAVQPKKIAKPVVKKVKPVKAAKPVKKPAIKTAAVVKPGSYVMQIASRRSAEAAQTSYNQLSRKFSRILSGRGVDIRRYKLKDKGIYYRVRVPAGSKSAAVNLCQKYKSAGGSCFVTR